MKQVLLTLALAVGSSAFAQTTPATTDTPAPATTAPATPASPAVTADPATPVATVGKTTVTLGEFEAFYRQMAGRTVNAQGVPLTDELLATFSQYRPQLLAQYARQRAVLQLAAAGGFQADAAKIDGDYAEAKSGFSSDAEFLDALKASGFADAAAFRTSLEESAAYGMYLDSLKSRFTFGDAVVAGYYQLHKAAFTQAAQACAKHILVGTQAEAQDIVKKLAAGSAFADLAKASSKDPGSAAQGGDLGCLGAGETVAPFDKAAFTGPLTTPQIVQTEFGWHVIVVNSRTAAGVQPLADVQAKIRDQLKGEAAQKYLDAQINKVKVVTMPELVTVAPDPAAAPAPASK